MQKNVFLGSAMAAAMAAFVIGCDKAEPVEQGNTAVADQPMAQSGVESDVVALPPPPRDTDVIASVGDVKMTWADLSKEVDEIIRKAEGQIPSDQLPQAKQYFRRALVQQFIASNVFEQAAAKIGFSVSDARVEEIIAEAEQSTGRKFADLVAERGDDLETVKAELKKDLLPQCLFEEKVFPSIVVTDEEVATKVDEIAAEIAVITEEMEGYVQEIAEDPATFETLVKANSEIKTPMDLRCSGVPWTKISTLKEGEISGIVDLGGAMGIFKLLKHNAAETPDMSAEKAKIDGIRERLLKGEDFAAVAKECSDCPSGAQGGSLGTFGKGDMVPEFEAAAFTQNVGEIGEVVETQFGFHIVKVTARNDEEGRVTASHILVKTAGRKPETANVLVLLRQVPQALNPEEVREKLMTARKREAQMNFFSEQCKAIGVTCSLFPEFVAEFQD